MAVNETIDSFIDLAATGAQQKTFLAQIAEAEAALLRVQKIKLSFNAALKTGEIVSGTKAATDSMEGLKKSTSETVVVVNSLKTAQDQLKIKNLELSAQLKQGTLDARAKATADKEAAAAVKQANKEAYESGAEKTRQIAEEKRKVEELAETYRKLDKSEERRLTGDSEAPSKSKPAEKATGPAFIPKSELESQINLLQKNQSALEGILVVQKNLKTAVAAGTISQGQYDQQMTKAVRTELEYRKAISDRKSTIGLIERETNSVKGSLEQRRAALIRLNKEYDNTSPQERSTAAGQRLQKIISGLTSQVQGLEVATGRAQRNVGAYPQVAASGFDKIGAAAGKAFSVLRNIAYIVPGLGIAGIIGLAIDPLSRFIEKTFGASEATKKATAAIEKEKEAVQDLVDNFRNISQIRDSALGSTAAEIGKVETLGKVILDVTNSQKERNRALLDLQAINKNYFGDLTTEKNGLTAVTQALADYTNAFVLQAVIKEVESDIGKIGAAYFKQSRILQSATAAVRENNQAFVKSNTDLLQANKGRVIILDKTALATARLGTEEDRQRKALKPLEDQYNSLKATLNDLNLQQLGFKPLVAEKTGKEATKLKAINEKRFEDELKQQAEFYKTLSKDDDFAFSDRISKREKAYTIEKGILERSLADQLRFEKEKLDSVTGDKKSDKNAKINAEAEYREAIKNINNASGLELKNLQSNLGSDLLSLRASYNLKQIADEKKTNDEFAQLLKDRAKFAEDSVKSELETRVNNLTFNRDAIIKSLTIEKNAKIAAANGEGERQKIEEKFQQRRLEVELETDRLILQATIETQEAILLTITDPRAREALSAKIIELKRRLEDLGSSDIKLKIDIDKAKAEQSIAALQKIKDAALQVFDLIGGAVAASVAAQKNALQEQSDQLEKNQQKEIDAINASGDTEEKKAAKIIAVNARVAAQKEILAQKQRQLDQRNAELQKARGIAEIVLNTAIAVSKQIAATPLPLGLPLVLAVGALGAAQLAIAIATPVPKFKTGTKDAPGGPAIMGDGFRAEVVQEPSGNMWLTSDKPTLYDLPKHSIVYPSVEDAMIATNKMALKGVRLQSAMTQDPNKAMAAMIQKELRAVATVIKNKPTPRIVKKFGGWTTEYETAHKQWNYINRVQ